jgi:hypothetical protein
MSAILNNYKSIKFASDNLNDNKNIILEVI